MMMHFIYRTFPKELLILSRGQTHFVNVFLDVVVQRDVSTQADIFLTCTSPKQPYTPVMEDDSTASFTYDMYINII